MFDTHCHINFNHYKNDADEVVARARDANVQMIVVGAQYSTSKRAVEVAHLYGEGVWAAVGLHPTHLFDMRYEGDSEDEGYDTRKEEFDYSAYKSLAKDEKTVAIGEMGVDYFHMPEGVDSVDVKLKQRELFIRGINLAQEVGKPLIVHTRPSTREARDAYDDTLSVLYDTGFANCVMHSFSGSKELARAFLNHGCMLSFTGVVTFKNAKDLQEVAKYVPLDRIMLETDAPYLTPDPYRGQRNEPAHVRYVANKIAELKGISTEEVIKITDKNAKAFFNLR